MSYAIIGTGTVGTTLARFFQKAGIEVLLANSRGVAAVKPIAEAIGDKIVPASRDAAIAADVVFVAVQFLDFKTVTTLRSDWTNQIIVDVTNANFLPEEVQKQELNGRPSSVVNAGRVPGGKLVKTFNQHPVQTLEGDPPAGTKRIMFVSADDPDASAAIARLFGNLGFASIELGRLDAGGVLIEGKAPLSAQNLLKRIA